MDRRRLQLNAMRAFEEVARHKSFRNAAEASNIAQSALSRHVMALEQSIGMRLFDRLPHGLALTPAGRELLAAVGKSFVLVCCALDEIREGLPTARNLRLYLAPSFARLVGVEALAEFRQLHPDIALDIVSLNGPREDGRAPDAAVVYAKPEAGDRVYDLLWPVRDTILCRPEIAATDSLQDAAAVDALIAANEL